MIPLEELKDYLGIPDSDTSGDPALLELERNAVAFIESQTGRYFGPVALFDEVLEGKGGRRLWLAERPVEPPDGEDEPMLSVEEHGGELIDPDDYRLRYMDKEAVLVRMSRGWTAHQDYLVTYWRGYPAGKEPGDIRQLVLDLVSIKRSLRQMEGLRSESIGGYSYTRFGDTDVDAAMGGWATIEAWKRPVLA